MPCNEASAAFMRMLSIIEPSAPQAGLLHYPCRIQTASGEWIERVICVHDSRGFATDTWIHPDDVVAISESDRRLPAGLATKLYQAGESGMGYECFEVSAHNHEDFACITYNVVDFPDLPDTVRTKDIRNVFPHRGRERYQTPLCFDKAPDFKWCYFVPPTGFILPS
jgi:hypothetical protein